MAAPPFFGSGSIGYGRIGRQQQSGDRRSILQRSAHHFGRIDDSRSGQIFKLTGGRIEPFVAFQLFHFADDHGAFDAGVFSNAPQRFLQRAPHNLDSGANIRIVDS